MSQPQHPHQPDHSESAVEGAASRLAAEAKQRLRAELLADFAELSPTDRARWSAALAQKVVELPEWKQSQGPVMAFLSMEDEIDTTPLLQVVWAARRPLLTPRSVRRHRRLIPTRLPSLDQVSTGVYGIREPTSRETLSPQELGWVFVPAVAFDRRGYRLGRGGGYYDRFLGQLAPGAVTCGVAFSRYLLDRVPVEPHDRSVQLIVTENEVVRP